jgi:hypothetical protein
MTIKGIAQSTAALLWNQRQELVVLIALALWVWGFWSVAWSVALAFPSIVMIWYALPSRPPFILRSDGKDRS